MEFPAAHTLVGKGIEGVGVVGIDQVKDLDDIAFFQQQRGDGPHGLTLWIGDQEAAICLHEVGLAEEARLARAGAADDDLQKITPVCFPVEAHTDILRKDCILKGVFVTILGIELPGIAPSGGAVFLAGPPVFPCGEV